MMRAIVLSTVLFFGGAAVAGCPEYLNHDLRKLHSQELINLCEMSPGQPLLIVNTASHCGYTKQFKGLQELNDQYRDQGLRVVGFASDDFRQEANNEEEAANVCYVNYGVTFTMFAPTHVRGCFASLLFKLKRRVGTSTSMSSIPRAKLSCISTAARRLIAQR
jgi:glutathione peroxidase